MKQQDKILPSIILGIISILLILGFLFLIIDDIKITLEECREHPNENITTKRGNLSCDVDGNPILTTGY